jgi:chloramphenicol-sensitive protein RarD
MSSASPDSDHTAQLAARRGVLAVACAFFIWGLLPLYLKPLNHVSALQIAAWRYLMGCLTVVGWIAWRGELAQVWAAFAHRALLPRLCLTASLLAVNWTLYAWGIANGQVLLTSLGYFINPLVNVLLGVAVLSERLNNAQRIAVSLALLAVIGLTVLTGKLPWIALVLAVTFSLYGLLRKTASVSPLAGLAVKTLLVAPLACGFLLFTQQQQGHVFDHSLPVMLLLAFSGVVTIVPLTLFNYGAQRINYATVGMLQYIGPTLQFITGVFIYKEALSGDRLACFGLIWLALLIYAGDSLLRARRY